MNANLGSDGLLLSCKLKVDATSLSADLAIDIGIRRFGAAAA
jgi:hypothetical protein